MELTAGNNLCRSCLNSGKVIMNVRPLVIGFGIALLGSLLAVPARSALITSSSLLPPDGVYVSPQDVHAQFTGPGLDALLVRPEHRPFVATVVRTPSGSDEVEEFDSIMTGISRVLNSPLGPLPDAPITLTGPVRTLVRERGASATGTFDTEMLSMTLTGLLDLGPIGQVPVSIRESPNLASLGQTTVADLGGGQFRIDSFFDVFTELSVDGGQTWIPSQGSSRMTLIPEPSVWLLLGLALMLGAGRRRR